MPKKFSDISAATDPKPISLRKTKKSPKKKQDFSIYKTKKRATTHDISHDQTHDFSYIKGKKIHNPHLSRLIKLAFAGFLIIALINVLYIFQTGKNLESDIKETAKQGFTSLMDAGKHINDPQDLAPFDQAVQIFAEAEQEYWYFGDENALMNNNEIIGSSISNALATGKSIALAGSYFSEALTLFQQIPSYFVIKNSDQDTYIPSITDTLKQGLESTDKAIEQINLASENLQEINLNHLPPDYRDKALLAQENVDQLTTLLTRIKTHFPAFLKLLGDRYPHRYLVLLQNNSEIRPTGGFIGSYLIVDLDEGYIEKFQAEDVYDIDGNYGGYIKPPEEIEFFTDNWRFHDSNYSPDFPTSAAKAAWFLEKEGGPGVDTVVAVNVTLLRKFLEITGPIQVNEFGKLDSQNYETLLSFIIESKIWGEEDPKHILKVFVPKFKDAILNENNITEISKVVFQAIKQKEIQAWSQDQEIQALFDEIGISGRVYQNSENEDYLNIIHCSIGGNKSDRFIKEEILHDTIVQEDGQIINDLTISRTHTWTPEDSQTWEAMVQEVGFPDVPEWLQVILGKGTNKVLTRIYVPEGSILLSANTYVIAKKHDPDVNKDYFLTAIQTDTASNSLLNIRYKIPITLDLSESDSYKLFAQKQAGSRGSIFTKTVTPANSDIKNYSLYPSEQSILEIDGSTTYATTLIYDRYFSSLWGK